MHKNQDTTEPQTIFEAFFLVNLIVTGEVMDGTRLGKRNRAIAAHAVKDEMGMFSAQSARP